MPVFLFTDIEGSTERWVQHPQAMEEALPRHDLTLGTAIVRHGGNVVKHTGDGLFAVFEGGDPLACALEIQRALTAQNWDAVGDLRVRIALHAGPARRHGDDYFGLEVSRTARLLSAGWGGQILLTCELARAATLPPGASLRDLGNHLLKDLSEPQHIYQLLHPDLPLREFPPLRTLSAHPHNLPPQPTPFVGRTEELREIGSRLQDPSCRLLTLIGPGGMGKTRLALQAAAEQIEAFTHGVYFVPLDAINDPALLAPAIAEALRISFYQRDAPEAQLHSYLREKQLLLLLDNFEHLAAGARLVAELLVHAPGLKILVTSRERLSLREEHIYAIAGMDFPTAASPALESYAAVQLFVQQAQLADPEFRLDAEQRACVAHICARVQGMPLALELAASWLRALSCAEVAEELAHNLDLLSSTQRDRPDRHRSLRAVFEYSWQLLDATEQEALSAWAVFQGAFRREAAAALLHAPEQRPSTAATLALLAALVDKSLLQRRHNDRYAMQALLHDYALEKLHLAPEREAEIRRRHCTYHAAFLHRQEAALQNERQKDALEAIAGAFEDLRAAWQWATQQRCLEALTQAAPSLAIFLTMRGRSLEGLALFDTAIAALETVTAPTTPVIRALLLSFRATFLIDLDRYDEARASAEAALEVQRRADARSQLASTLNTMGRIAWVKGDYTTALAHYREALTLYQAEDDLTGQAHTYDHLGTVAWALGDYTEAHRHFEQALAFYRRTQNPRGIANVLDHLGVTAREIGDYETALQCFRESVERLQDLGAPLQLAYAANHLAGMLAMKEGLAGAAPYFEQCIATGREIGERRIVAYTLYDWALMLTEESARDRAVPMFQESLALFEHIGDQFGLALAQTALGDVALDRDDHLHARQYYAAALQTACNINNQRVVSRVLIQWGQLLAAEPQPALAVEVLCFAQQLPSDIEQMGRLLQETLAQLREQLSPEAFAEAQARGAAATLEQLTSRLLDISDSATLPDASAA